MPMDHLLNDMQAYLDSLDAPTPEPFLSVTVNKSGKVSLGKKMTKEEFRDRIFDVTLAGAILLVVSMILFWIGSAVYRDREHVDEDRRFAAACSAMGGVTRVSQQVNDPPFRCFKQSDIVAVTSFKVGP